MDKPVVAIFSDSNTLSTYLVEYLLSKNCEVVVFAPDKKDWQIKTSRISLSSNFIVADEKDFVFDPTISYAIFCFGFLGLNDPLKKFISIYSKANFKEVKSIAIFPAELFSSDENSSLPLNNNLSVVYTGDILGPRIDFSGGLRINHIMREIVTERSISAGIGEVFYPLFAPSAAKLISKWVFSFGPFGKEIFVLGPEISVSGLWREVAKIIPDVRLYTDNKIKAKPLPRGFAREIVESNLAFILKETFRGALLAVKEAAVIKSQKKRINKPTKIAALALILVLIVPFLSLIISGALVYSAYRLYLSGKPETTRNVLYASKPISRLGEIESGTLKYVPLLGLVYKETAYGLFFTGKVADIGISAIPALEASKEYMSKVLGNEVYDPTILAKELERSFGSVYQLISMLEAETKEKSQANVQGAKKALANIDFEKIRNLSFFGTKISESLPELLGREGRKTYLLLFQNNTELRPAGGFIGSFALVTFEGGRMTDFSVSDVYSADGQLNGHIEPPRPIKDYLGEASWFLRDSNWDPDFPTSAKRAEWFIDKEIDRQVDGVIGVDLNPVKDALIYTGPIYLADYQTDITNENLYEKTQAEVHEDFFPGSHKKASFLTALSRNLVLLLGGLNSKQKAGILKTSLVNLEARHIQIYLHEEKAQDLISQIGWAGEVSKKECKEGCYGDFLGLVEANVGVNKANYFITRDMDLKVKFDGGSIRRDLTLTFKNSGNPGLGPAAKYKSYVRLLIPSDSEVEGSFDITEARGLKEVGFLIEVLAGEERQVNISWSTQTNEEKYALYVRKQAGTGDNDKLSVAYDGLVVYNSNLTKDEWIQKP